VPPGPNIEPPLEPASLVVIMGRLRWFGRVECSVLHCETVGLTGLQVTSPKGHWSDICVECNDQANIHT